MTDDENDNVSGTLEGARLVVADLPEFQLAEKILALPLSTDTPTKPPVVAEADAVVRLAHAVVAGAAAVHQGLMPWEDFAGQVATLGRAIGAPIAAFQAPAFNAPGFVGFDYLQKSADADKEAGRT